MAAFTPTRRRNTKIENRWDSSAKTDRNHPPPPTKPMHNPQKDDKINSKEQPQEATNMPDETTLIFTGDIGFDKYMDHKWEDEHLVSDEILSYLHTADHLIINVEGPLSKQEKVVRDNGVVALTHSMDPAATDFFHKIGADVWNICNTKQKNVACRH